ncbi:MAG TPA: ABC transporter permease subunit [Phycisphaerales bacterium]|nr:ABC transporter permease subunit [Phycisphaerales bacterium]
MTKLREFLGRCNRLQQRRGFKLIATGVVIVLAIASAVAYAVRVDQVARPELEDVTAAEVMPEGQPTFAPDSPEAKQLAAQLEAENRARQIYRKILAGREDPTSTAVGIAIVAGLLLAVVWLGLALTYLGLGLGAGALVGIIHLLGHWLNVGQSTVPLVLGLAALTAAFTALMRLARVLLGSAHPALAVARNVLDEAVRMKISLVFIVLLIFGLAALPGLLEDDTFLRYRIQSFMQYGTGGSFWLIAVLVLTFSASSVTFEQRDKVIWQTMTKPVKAWHYVFGKWLGVVTLAGVLLAVSASGVFLFTEYLRNQPASGEATAYRAPEGAAALSEDRFIIETQLLAARETKQPDPLDLDQGQLMENVATYVERELKRMADAGDQTALLMEKKEEIRERYLKDLPKSLQMAYRTISPGQRNTYIFSGLKDVRNSTSPLLLRLKVNAGGNMPDQTYHLTIFASDGSVRTIETPLNQFISVRPPILPTAVGEDGKFTITIYNGRPTAEGRIIPNAETISFPPDGMELSYAEGSYRLNFFRCVAVLWVKLAFLAMTAVCAGTFLSFPVACLVAFAVFLAAEGASSVLTAIDYYQTEDREGNVMPFHTAIAFVATWVSRTFKIYSDLEPTKRLVEGLRLSWSQMIVGVGVLSVATALLMGAGVVIFRRRELATYSGQ